MSSNPLFNSGTSGRTAKDPADVQAANETRREELLAHIALLQVEGLGITGINRLLTHYGSARAVLDCGQPAPHCLQGLGRRARQNLAQFLAGPRQGAAWQLARQSLAWLARNHAEIILRGDTSYPEMLTEISDAPPLLFLRGDSRSLSQPGIAIVGTRKPSALGRRFAAQLAAELGAAGFTVCSGLALGIDAEAHRGALQANARTIAVMATGVDHIYPASHRSLAEAICAHGALLSEMPLGTPAVPGLFPRRNRLVSGLCQGVVVIEAGLPSGTLHTANFAAEQNREVFAVPGAVNNVQARGCHQLLREGAHLVESAADVLAVLGAHVSARPDTPGSGRREPAADTLPGDWVAALAALDAEPADFELLVQRCELGAAELGSALVELELQGLVLCDAGCYSLPP